MARQTLRATEATAVKLDALIESCGALVPGPKGLMINDDECVALIKEIARSIDKPKWQVVQEALREFDQR